MYNVILIISLYFYVAKFQVKDFSSLGGSSLDL